MNVNGYKRDILENQYEELLAGAEQARSDGDLQTAAKGYRGAADRLQQLETLDHETDYEGRIRRLQRAASLAEDGQDPGDRDDESPDACGPQPSDPQDDDPSEEFRSRVESFISETEVTWADIGGLEGVQEQIKRAIALGAVDDTPPAVRPTDSVLMFGPPGTGKTLIAAAVAGSLNATFFDVKLGGLLSKYFGESSKQISALFDLAAEMSPSVVFLDEIDALTQSRNADSDQTSRRVLNTLLSELDGIDKGEDSFTLVLGATNKPGHLDNAVRRRFPERFLIPLPDEDAAEQIVEINTTEAGVEFARAPPESFAPADGATRRARSPEEIIARACVERQYTGSDIEALCRRAVDAMVRRANPDLVSFADGRLEGALQYDLTVEPITPADVQTAYEQTSPSLSAEEVAAYDEWNAQYGTGPSAQPRPSD